MFSTSIISTMSNDAVTYKHSQHFEHLWDLSRRLELKLVGCFDWQLTAWCRARPPPSNLAIILEMCWTSRQGKKSLAGLRYSPKKLYRLEPIRGCPFSLSSSFILFLQDSRTISNQVNPSNNVFNINVTYKHSQHFEHLWDLLRRLELKLVGCFDWQLTAWCRARPPPSNLAIILEMCWTSRQGKKSLAGLRYSPKNSGFWAGWRINFHPLSPR